MVAKAAQLESARDVAPAEWALLLPWDGEQGTLWQVWMRDKGAAYWLMKLAVRVVNFVGEREASLRGRVWHRVTNPHALEDGGTYPEQTQAEDRCRIAFVAGKAATICPVIVGRAYPDERVAAAGDFDPFKVYDFSATDAVREQARHWLISDDQIEEIKAILSGRQTAEPRL